MGWFWWLRNFRREGATWTDQALRLGAATRHPLLPDASHGRPVPPDPRSSLTPLAAVDPVEAYLADPEAEKDHPSHRLRTKLRMLDLFLRAETGRSR